MDLIAQRSRVTPPVITIVIPGPVGGVGTDVTANWFRVPVGGLNLVGAKAHIVAKTVPGGGTNPSWDIMRSTNSGSSFATILPSGASNKLPLTVGNRTADLTPAWTTTLLNEGDLLRVDVVATDDGSATDIVITIELV